MKDKFLLVDDNPAHRMLTTRALHSALPQISVLEASDYEEACVIVSNHGKELLLAIIDLKLDHQSGVDVLQVLKGSPCAEIPALIVSTSDHPAHMQECYAAGASSYIVKGADPALFAQNLLSAVKYFLSLK